jgi:hypothetical protein
MWSLKTIDWSLVRPLWSEVGRLLTSSSTNRWSESFSRWLNCGTSQNFTRWGHFMNRFKHRFILQLVCWAQRPILKFIFCLFVTELICYEDSSNRVYSDWTSSDADFSRPSSVKGVSPGGISFSNEVSTGDLTTEDVFEPEPKNFMFSFSKSSSC